MKLSDFVGLLIDEEIDKNEFLLLYHYYEYGHCPDETEAKLRLKMKRATYFKAAKGVKEKFNKDIFDSEYKFGGKEPIKLP